MQRTTITLDDDLMTRLDEFMSDRRYANRSEAIRDLVRSGLEQAAIVAAPVRSASPRRSTSTTTRNASCRGA